MNGREAKLVQLRNKTDRDLLILVRRELDRGLTLASVAASKQSPLYVQAEKVHNTATTLLPRIGGLTEIELRELSLKMKEVRAALDQLPSETVSRFVAGACGAEG